MNPRHRRLLIPGLLIILLVVVVISSLARKADAATAEPQTVSTLQDPRINESSGLVLGADDPDLAYTINDSGNAPVVYAVKVSTGATVGTTTIDADLADTEAMSSDRDGMLWIADTGDNKAVRTDTALYSLPEPGPGDHGTRSARRYPITYPGGPLDVEALVIDPTTGDKFLISKGLFGGTVFAVPDDLVEGRPNEVVALNGDIPGLVTDAAFTPDGRYVVARDYSDAFVLDPVTWKILSTFALPDVEQGETLAMEPGGASFLVGSEGVGSPLIRVAFAEPAGAGPTPSAAASGPPPGQELATQTGQTPPDGNGFAGQTWFWGFLVVGLLAVISFASTTRRS